MTRHGLDVRDRFYLHVDMMGGEDACWWWMGAVGTSGYGTFASGGDSVAAHRFMWELQHDESVPAGMCIMHTCDNKLCVNPRHLRLGTIADNNADRDAKGRTVVLRGERHGNAKLTEDQVIQMKHDHEVHHIPVKALAEKYHVSWQHVYRILNGQLWGHVE